jgi:hypothetical protein
MSVAAERARAAKLAGQALDLAQEIEDGIDDGDRTIDDLVETAIALRGVTLRLGRTLDGLRDDAAKPQTVNRTCSQHHCALCEGGWPRLVNGCGVAYHPTPTPPTPTPGRLRD